MDNIVCHVYVLNVTTDLQKMIILDVDTSKYSNEWTLHPFPKILYVGLAEYQST